MPFRDKVPFLFWHCALFAPAPCPFGILAGALIYIHYTNECYVPFNPVILSVSLNQILFSFHILVSNAIILIMKQNSLKMKMFLPYNYKT